MKLLGRRCKLKNLSAVLKSKVVCKVSKFFTMLNLGKIYITIG